MADSLNGKVFAIDAAIAGFSWEFRLGPDGAALYDLVDCAIALKFYPLADRSRTLEPVSTTPAVTLSIGNGLERIVDADPELDGNQPSVQRGTLRLTPTQAATLLGDQKYRFASYQWRVTLAGGGPILATAIGDGYDGRVGLCLPGYGLEALERLRG